MAIFDNDERKIFLGMAIGAVAVGVLRGIVPAFRGLGRPIAKAAIKSGITLYEKGREKGAQLGEVFEDLVAEARAELAAEARVASAEQSGMPPQPESGGLN